MCASQSSIWMPITHTHTHTHFFLFHLWSVHKLGVNSKKDLCNNNCNKQALVVCKYHFGSKGMTWNQTGSLSQQMNDSSLSVTWALILTIYLICLSVSLSPSFFQSAALWCTSVAMNSSPSPAPEQIRVLHQMWVQKCLPFPSFLHSSAFCLPFSLSLLFNLCPSLSQSHVRQQRKEVGRSCCSLANLIRPTVTEEVCETAGVTITLFFQISSWSLLCSFCLGLLSYITI